MGISKSSPLATADEKMMTNGKFKTVAIQKLSTITPDHRTDGVDGLAKWKSEKCKHGYSYSPDGKGCACEFLAYEENCVANVDSYGDAFFIAALHAYNNHKDVVLSPDDVWLRICLQFSRYINNHAEEMRKMFVDHDGKMELSVTTWNETKESEWEEFFNLMAKAIKEKTKDGIVDTLKANFTTTGRVESVLSTAVVMNSLKRYFSYGRCIPCCGIRNVHFMGTLDDWNSLLARTRELKKYAVTEEWTKYIAGLEPILTKFIETYNGTVDVDFWNRIMNLTRGRLGSGSTTYVSGWILNFYGLAGNVDVDDIKEEHVDVPVMLDNKLTGVTKMVHLVGGFGGVNKTGDCYRPQMSMVVYWDGKVASA